MTEKEAVETVQKHTPTIPAKQWTSAFPIYDGETWLVAASANQTLALVDSQAIEIYHRINVVVTGNKAAA